MSISSLAKHLLSLLYLSPLLFRTIGAQTNAPQQIFTESAFQEQQTCVQNCFTFRLSGCTTDILGSFIGCPINSCTLATGKFGAMDSCYCRSDLQLAAQEWIMSCVRDMCSVGDTSVIIATAVSIYEGYCSSRGYAAAPADTAANTTPAGTGGSNPTASPGTSASSKSTAGGSASVPSSPPSSSSSSSSSNTAVYIALGVVSAMLVIACTVGFFCVRRYKQSKRRIHQGSSPMQMGYMNQGQYTPSTHPLRSDVSSHISIGRPEVRPEDSASNLGVPPSYPLYSEPSLVSTAMR